MKVGILGSGDVGKTLAAGFLKHGHAVIIGTRTPEKLAEWGRKSPQGRVGGFDGVAKFAEWATLSTKVR
ncbi:MAG: NAD(P)-binding domain-containing protein [Candidatus Acidiferrum sp.]